MTKPFYVGTAAWTLPKEHRHQFPNAASILESYAQVFNSVEINSSFYRHHQGKTYQRWADCVPDSFKFSVKLFRGITHDLRLKITDDELKSILEPIRMLDKKLGCLLVQLPPSFAFNTTQVEIFLKQLRKHFHFPVVIEPRHLSWKSEQTYQLLRDFEISKVWSDPDPINFNSIDCVENETIHYFRLHGSPVIYESEYGATRIQEFADLMRVSALRAQQVWCIFDNTKYGFATADALRLLSSFLKDPKKESNLYRDGSTSF